MLAMVMTSLCWPTARTFPPPCCARLLHEAPLTLALSPRGEGVRDRCGIVPSPLGEKDRMRGPSQRLVKHQPAWYISRTILTDCIADVTTPAPRGR